MCSVVASLTGQMAAQSSAYHAHETADSDKSYCYPWFVCHDKILNQQCMLAQARPPMIDHLTSYGVSWYCKIWFLSENIGVYGKSLKNDQATRLFLKNFFGDQSWKKMVYKQQNTSWRSGDKTTKCVSNEPKYRGLDEDNACRLCKHCGCMLNTDYIWLHKSSSR